MQKYLAMSAWIQVLPLPVGEIAMVRLDPPRDACARQGSLELVVLILGHLLAHHLRDVEHALERDIFHLVHGLHVKEFLHLLGGEG